MVTKRSTKAPEGLDLNAMYLRWLKGESLRAIAPEYGVSHNTVSAYLCNRFGPDATDPMAMSLQRSLLADYPDNAYYESWVLANLDYRDSDTKYRSNHNLQQLGSFQNARDPGMMTTLARDIRDPYDFVEPEPGPLSLPFLVLLISCINAVLWSSICYPVVDRTAERVYPS